MSGLFAVGQAGYEQFLAEELEAGGWQVLGTGDGWVRAEREPAGREPGVGELCFPHGSLIDPVEISGGSVNALAGQAMDYLLETLRGERIETPWLCRFEAPREPVGLARRVRGVEKAFSESLKKKLGRLARLASFEAPRGPAAVRGLFVYFVDFGRAFAARDIIFGGQRRMADDPQAPSRSYLKVEEAFMVLGREPGPDEAVADLGAAPGGWSYAAARRGAHVVAVDNGPLKGGALNHPRIRHAREDAFKFRPEEGRPFDWLLCDLVEEPHQVVRLLAQWLRNGWCRHFVVNLKFGRARPLELLREVQDPGSGLAGTCELMRVRHLFHDREEITVMGSIG